MQRLAPAAVFAALLTIGTAQATPVQLPAGAMAADAAVIQVRQRMDHGGRRSMSHGNMGGMKHGSMRGMRHGRDRGSMSHGGRMRDMRGMNHGGM